MQSTLAELQQQHQLEVDASPRASPRPRSLTTAARDRALQREALQSANASEQSDATARLTEHLREQLERQRQVGARAPPAPPALRVAPGLRAPHAGGCRSTHATRPSCRSN